MLKLLQAGLVAAGRQLVAVVIVTLLASWLASHDLIVRGASTISSGTETIGIPASLLLWMYLLIATGLALTKSQSVELTAAWIGHACSRMRLARPEDALMTLVLQLGISAIAFAIFALRTPPEALIDTATYFECVSAVSIIWAATMSVGVACFGASAHAALKALKAYRPSR
jgi:hypothetical protein